jgi:hypothetical protein
MKVKHLLQLDVFLRGGNQPLLALTALEKLLGLADEMHSFQTTATDWLLQVFGAEAAAPYSALGDGLPARQGYWLRADPVYLHLMRDRIILPQPAVDDIGVEEAQPLVQALNTHFTELRFYAPHPQRWYVQTPNPQQLITREPEQVVGQDIRPNMPQGADGKAWVGWLNEAQMLLHQHPVNAAREAAGKMPVNGLWLWGGGNLQAPPDQPYDQYWGNDPLLAGLAGDKYTPLPGNLQDCLQHQAQRQLLVLADAQGWESLECLWFAPLWAALKAKQVETVQLMYAESRRLHVAAIRRGDLWKFWQRGKGVWEWLGK